MSDGSDDEGSIMLFAPSKRPTPAQKPAPLPIILASPASKSLPLIDDTGDDERAAATSEDDGDDDEEIEEDEEQEDSVAEGVSDEGGPDEDKDADDDADDDEDEGVEDGGGEDAEGEEEEDKEEDDDDDDGDENGDDIDDDDVNEGGKKLPVVKGMSEKRMAKWMEQNEKKGVVYMSRVPPFMRPAKVRDLMAPYGEVGRVYLKAESRDAAYKRKKRGGNKKKKYTEGWIEFMDKEVAEAVAATLNATPIGDQVRKGSFFYNDLWCLKYLPGFKWHHLTEKQSYDRAVRMKRRRTEIQQVKRENNQYLLQVEKAKTKKRIAEKRKRELAEGEAAGQQPEEDEKFELEKLRNRFRQRMVSKEAQEDIEALLPDQSRRNGPNKRQRTSANNRQSRGDRKAEADDDDEPTPTGGELSEDFLAKIFGKRG